MTTDCASAQSNRQRGFTLVELMVALTIGLIVTGVTLAVFLASSRNYNQDEIMARMQENARFAMHLISQDLGMIEFYGPMVDLVGSSLNTSVRDCTGADSSDSEICGGFFAGSKLTMDSGDDCGPGVAGLTGIWSFNVNYSIEILRQATGEQANTTFGCIDSDEFKSSSNILALKRVLGRPLSADRNDSSDNGTVFLRTNGATGMLFEYDNTAAAPVEAEDWEYMAHVYYIKEFFQDPADAIPTLYRKQLEGNQMTEEAGGIAPGIEQINVTFGIDEDDDGVADLYKSQVTSAELASVVTARIFVLARSIDADFTYTNGNSYQLGDLSVDFSGSPDNFYRRVFTTTVQIRNKLYRNLLGNST